MAPLDSGGFSELGGALARSGLDTQAIAAHLRAVTLRPDGSRPYMRLAGTLAIFGQLAAATAVYREAFTRVSKTRHTYEEQGHMMWRLKNFLEAKHLLARAFELNPANSAVALRLADAAAALGELEPAETVLRKTLQRSPNDAGILLLLAQLLLRRGRHDLAETMFAAAARLAPLSVEACLPLVSRTQAGRTAHDLSARWLQLGAAMLAAGRQQQAIVAFLESLRQGHHKFRALRGIAAANFASGSLRQAVRHYRDALTLNPLHVDTHNCLGKAMLSLAPSRRAVRELSWLMHPSKYEFREFHQELWNGTRLDRRTILLWGHHGLGDTIQCLRSVPLARQRGAARVIVECEASLVPLVERMRDVDRVVAFGAPLPHFDVHAPLLTACSLPRRPSENCRVPYLSVDEYLVEAWRQRLPPKRRVTVGLVWGGGTWSLNSRTRFAPLADFAALAAVSDVRFVALQTGAPTNEIVALPREFKVIPLPERSITDTAAVIMNIDLVISVDAMVAHLAGALGRPVWVALSRVCDRRWQAQGTSSLFYPSMRVFRQAQLGNWEELFHRISHELAAFVSGRNSLQRNEEHVANR